MLVATVVELDQASQRCVELLQKALAQALRKPVKGTTGECRSPPKHGHCGFEAIMFLLRSIAGPEAARESTPAGLKAMFRQVVAHQGVACVPYHLAAGRALQLVCEDELQNQIAQRAASGQPVGRRNQRMQKGASAARPIVVVPGLVRIKADTFVKENGKFLPQIQMHQLGPQAEGVVVASLEQAQPYLQAGKAVSTGALGLLVMGTDEHMSDLPAQSIRFPAVCDEGQDPASHGLVTWQGNS